MNKRKTVDFVTRVKAWMPSGVHVVMRKNIGMRSFSFSGWRFQALVACLLGSAVIVVLGGALGLYSVQNKVSTDRDKRELTALVLDLKRSLESGEKELTNRDRNSLLEHIEKMALVVDDASDKPQPHESSDIIKSRRLLVQQLAQREEQLNAAARSNERLKQNISLLASQVNGLEAKKNVIESELLYMEEQISALQSGLVFEKDRARGLTSAIGQVIDRMAGVVGARNVKDTDSIVAADLLAKRLEKLFNEQTQIFDKITADTASYLYDARRILSDVGLDQDKVAPLPDSAPVNIGGLPANDSEEAKTQPIPEGSKVLEDAEGGRGGLFEPEPVNAVIGKAGLSYKPSPGEKFASSLQRMKDYYKSAGAAAELVSCIPSGLPMKKFRRSSGFGYRSDPFTKKLSFHAGFDMTGEYRAPVYATAKGKVLRAGYTGPYGKAVVIDHGCGFRSLFAHLYSIAVRAGQTVKAGDNLGKVGSTGRSTGPHLHYEIIFKGSRYDPEPFFGPLGASHSEGHKHNEDIKVLD